MKNKNNLEDMILIKGKYRLVERIYIAILILLYVLIICTPYLLSNKVLLKNDVFIGAEFLAGLLIAVLLVISYFVSVLYRKTIDKYNSQIKELSIKKADVEHKLNDAFKYIGTVNVQIEAIKSLFSSLKEYPKDKKDLKNCFHLLAEKVFCLAKVDWVIFRIINTDNLKTMREYSETKGQTILLKHTISNKSIISEAVDSCSVVSSDQKNLTIKVFCILPSNELTETQKHLIKAIADTMEMLFIIFKSKYYREDYFKQEVLGHAELT
jgi:hypothetical protein